MLSQKILALNSTAFENMLLSAYEIQKNTENYHLLISSLKSHFDLVFKEVHDFEIITYNPTANKLEDENPEDTEEN